MSLASYKLAKRQGYPAKETWKKASSGVRAMAKEEGWTRASLLDTIADEFELLVKVYGKKATQGLL